MEPTRTSWNKIELVKRLVPERVSCAHPSDREFDANWQQTHRAPYGYGLLGEQHELEINSSVNHAFSVAFETPSNSITQQKYSWE